VVEKPLRVSWEFDSVGWPSRLNTAISQVFPGCPAAGACSPRVAAGMVRWSALPSQGTRSPALYPAGMVGQFV